MATDTAGFGKEKTGVGVRLVMVLFGLPFLAAGLGFLWFGGVSPLITSIQAQAWPQVTCTILESQVIRSSSSDGTSYRPHIVFEYVWTGTRYTSDQATVVKHSSDDRQGARKQVEAHPVGGTARCFVNPNDPSRAILDVSLPGLVWFIIPFSSVFVLLGGGIVLAGLGILPDPRYRRLHRKISAAKASEPSADNPIRGLPAYDPNERDYRTLMPEAGPVAKFAVILGFALFWNGIVSVFVYQVVRDFSRGDGSWFFALFISIFVGVGLLLIGAVVYQFLALFNPRYTLTAEPGLPRPGETVRISFRCRGNFRRLRRLTITLEGKEVARYRQGSSTRTLSEPFNQQVLFDERETQRFGAGTLTGTIPADSYPSFKARHNEIVWQLTVNGDVPRWPDVDSTYPIIVLPDNPHSHHE
ncbi:MAG: DUF3592 domain-containing protein [Opitutales bacterium]